MNRRRTKGYLLVLFLAAAHLLYAPAWQAGWMMDVSGWLEALHTQSFTDYLLRRGLRVESLYPFTQAMLWFWWKLFGVHPLPWHLLLVSMHALCAWGWMLFYRRAIAIRYPQWAGRIGFMAGAVLLVSPYATEAVVWQAGYHYMQGMLLMLATLYSALRFVTTGNRRWVAPALLAFLPSLFALEVFLLTPVYVAVLLWWGSPVFPENARKGYRYLVLPLLLLCVLQYGVYRLLYSGAVPHIKTLTILRLGDYLRKPAKYFYHLFAFGRYWPTGVQKGVFAVLNSWTFLAVFYGSLAFGLWRFHRRLWAFRHHPLLLPVAYALAALALVTPLYFQEGGLAYFDRYAYFMLPAMGGILGGWLGQPVYRRLWLALSVVLLLYTNWVWRQSDALNRHMLFSIPDCTDGRTTVLLNMPNALKSIPMTGMNRAGEAALMRKYVLQKPLHSPTFEPSTCNLLSPFDTVAVQQTESGALTIKQPNQQGWWEDGSLSADWENEAFAAQFLPDSQTYRLRLKRPPENYHLLYWHKGQWLEWKAF